MKIHLIFLVIIIFSGCAGGLIEQSREARHAMLESKKAYQACLKQNPEDVQKCQGYKEIYEVDLQTYKVISNDLNEIFNDNPSITIKDNR
jgi:hypothetical protein